MADLESSAAPAVSEAAAPVAALQLSDVERMGLLLWDAEMRAASAEAQLAKIERATYLARIDPDGGLWKFDALIASKKNAGALATAERKEVVTAIETRLLIKLSEYSFDDRSGVLHHLEAPVAMKSSEEAPTTEG